MAAETTHISGAVDIGTNEPLEFEVMVTDRQVLITAAGDILPVGMSDERGYRQVGFVLPKARARELGKFLAAMDA